MEKTEERILMTVNEVAQFLHVSRSTVYRLIDLGMFPTYKVGERIRIKREDVEKYLEEQKQEK